MYAASSRAELARLTQRTALEPAAPPLQRRPRRRRPHGGLESLGALGGDPRRRALGGRGAQRLVAPAGAHGVQGRRRAIRPRHRRGHRVGGRPDQRRHRLRAHQLPGALPGRAACRWPCRCWRTWCAAHMAEADDWNARRRVIGQEIAEAADAPDDQVFDLAQAHAFSGQALGRPILGTVESIGRPTPGGARRLPRGALQPRADRGQRPPARWTRTSCWRWPRAAFGDCPPRLRRSADPAGRFVGGAEAEARKLEQAHLVLLLPGVGASDPDYFALRLFAEILGGGMSSRLFQIVREQTGPRLRHRRLLPRAMRTRACSASTPAAPPLTRIGPPGSPPSRSPPWRRRPAAAELARAKAQLKAQLFMGRESPLARAEQAAAHLHLFDHLLTPETLSADIDATSMEDLRRVGGRLLGSGRTALAVLGPKRAGAALQAFTHTAQAA